MPSKTSTDRYKQLRKDRKAVPNRLMEVAEQLIGERGITGISLREITRAAGTANNYAVQYHFGDLAGLLRSILVLRLPEVEAIRRGYFADAELRNGLDDLRILMEILYRPLIDHRDKYGKNTFARFFLALLNDSNTLLSINNAAELFNEMPTAIDVLNRIANLTSNISQELLLERQRLISIMVLNSVFNRLSPWDSPDSDQAVIDNVIDMATSALTASVTESVRDLLKTR